MTAPETILPSQLEQKLRAGQFAVAAELSPPRGVSLKTIAHQADLLRGHVDAVNVTDNQAASVRMASIPVCALLVQQGIEPVAQMTARDRNRLAIQADLLGAAALGIRNLLCLSGDHGRWGDHPHAKGVYDIDSNHLIHMAHNLVHHGCLDNGRKIQQKPYFFIGAAANPFAPPFEYRPYRLAKKIAAGAQFVQTQLIYKVDLFRTYMQHVRDLGLAYELAGMEVPEAIVQRMEKTPKEKQAEEGIQICLEIIEQVREIPGVAGLHIMSVHWAEAVSDIVQRAGLGADQR